MSNEIIGLKRDYTGYRVDVNANEVIEVHVIESGFGSHRMAERLFDNNFHFGNYCIYMENKVTYVVVDEYARSIFTCEDEAQKWAYYWSGNGSRPDEE